MDLSIKMIPSEKVESSRKKYLAKVEKGKELVWGIGILMFISCGCHIDTAWLYPYHVTQQKIACSWLTQVDLLDRYELRFSCSCTQQYKWLQQVFLAAETHKLLA